MVYILITVGQTLVTFKNINASAAINVIVLSLFCCGGYRMKMSFITGKHTNTIFSSPLWVAAGQVHFFSQRIIYKYDVFEP